MARQDELTQALRGFTTLRSMAFSVDLHTGVCTLILDLTESESKGAKAILAEFSGVSNLFIRNFGGGLTQLLLLAIEDIRNRQLDRINYEVKDLERESISFFCQKLTITSMGEQRN